MPVPVSRSTPQVLRRPQSVLGPAAGQALVQGADQLHVERVARAVGDDVAAQVGAEQGQVADQVEDLVAGGLVGVAQAVVEGAARPEDQQVGGGGAGPQALAAQ